MATKKNAAAAAPTWRCPSCKRAFSRKNQRHACGTGDRADVLRNRSPELVRIYAQVEKHAKSLGAVEVVARDRYVLFRSTRIFADLVMMTDAVRIAVHLGRKVDDPIFFKVVAGDRFVTHVAKLRTDGDVRTVKPLIAEAYAFSIDAPKGTA
jgi:hypothetical protein